MSAQPNTRHRSLGDGGRLLAPLVLCLLVGVAFVSLDIPGESRFRHALQNAGHGLAFTALAFVSLLSLGVRDARRRVPIAVLVGAVSVTLFALGIGIEIAQQLTGRGASARDLPMNLGGIVSGSAFALATRSGTGQGARRTARLVAAAIGLLALLWCLRLPLAIVVVDATAPEPPVLATFDRPFALARLAGGSTPAALSLHEADPRWPDNPTTVLEARFPIGLWPGFRLVEPFADWRPYRTLSMNVVNPGRDPVRLNVRVDQRAEGEDIFRTASRTLEPGTNALVIELDTMRPDVELDARRADHEPFAAMFQMLVFLSRNRAPVTLLFDDVRLQP